MGVYALCEICGRRRESCAQPLAHKRRIAWVADWQPSRNERRIYKTYNSTHTNPKQLAEDCLASWKTDHKRGQLGMLKVKPTLFGPLVEKYWSEHVLVSCRRPKMVTFYMVEKWRNDWIGNDRKLSPLTDDEMKTFQNDLRSLQRQMLASGLAGSTVNRYFGVGHSICERGREWGLVKANPFEFINKVQEEKPNPRFLEKKEIDLLFATAAQLKDENGNPIEADRKQRLIDFMTVITHTGARPSSIEECSFDNGDVDFNNRVIWFTTYKGGKQKKHRYPVPMDDDIFSLVHKRAEITGRRGLVFDCAGRQKLETLCIDQSRLNEGKLDNQRFTMYGLKHCYASHLLMMGATEREVGELLGHTDARMIRKHYGHLTIEHLRGVQNKINLTRVVPQLKVV